MPSPYGYNDGPSAGPAAGSETIIARVKEKRRLADVGGRFIPPLPVKELPKATPHGLTAGECVLHSGRWDASWVGAWVGGWLFGL